MGVPATVDKGAGETGVVEEMERLGVFELPPDDLAFARPFAQALGEGHAPAPEGGVVITTESVSPRRLPILSMNRPQIDWPNEYATRNEINR